jgi:hypothetical protein
VNGSGAAVERRTARKPKMIIYLPEWLSANAIAVPALLRGGESSKSLADKALDMVSCDTHFFPEES